MVGSDQDHAEQMVIRDTIDPTLEIVYDDPREGDAGHTGGVSKVEMDHSDE